MPTIGGKPIPFGRGWYNTGVTIDDKFWDSTQSDYVGDPAVGLEGVKVTRRPKNTAHVPYDRGATTRAVLSHGDTVWLFVRNAATIALLPKKMVIWKAGLRGRQVNGYSGVYAVGPAEVAGVVDPAFASAGVPIGECFWLQVGGPCLVTKTAEAATDAAGDTIEGGLLRACTAQSSTGATTEGRIAMQKMGLAATTQTNEIQNAVGRAMSAQTSANTNVDILVDLSLPLAHW